MNKQLTNLNLESRILYLPGRPPAMLSSDLAWIFGTSTKMVNRAIKRNPDRFPTPDFCFRLTDSEWENLRCQNGTSSWGGDRVAPLALTQMGANMLPSVLKTKIAAQRMIEIVRVFSAVEQQHMAGLDVPAYIRDELLAARPKWRKIQRYKDMGLNNNEIGLLMRVTASTVRKHVRRMERVGLLETPANLFAQQQGALPLFGGGAA